MPDRPYQLRTNPTMPQAPMTADEEIIHAIRSLKYHPPKQEIVTQTSHPPAPTTSLDAIVHKAAAPSQDVAERVMQDKRTFLRATTKLLKNLLDDRTRIKEENIARLDYKISECGSYLLNVEPWPPYSNPMVEARRANLGNAINRLESEKNHEVARCWSDQSRLYQELQQTLGEYQAVVRRSELVSAAYLPHPKTFARDSGQ